MEDETELVRDDASREIDRVTDEYHEAKLASEGEATTAVRDVCVRDDLSKVFLSLELGGSTEWIGLTLTSNAERAELVEKLTGGEGLAQLPGSEVPVKVGDSTTIPPVDELVSSHANSEPEVGTTEGRTVTAAEPVSTAPEYARNVTRFDRVAALHEASTYGSSCSIEAATNVTVDDDELSVSVRPNGTTATWTFDVPGVGEFEDSALPEFIEAVGAGDPSGLDGHVIDVVPAGTDSHDELILSDDLVAGVPVSSEESSQPAEEETQSESRHRTSGSPIGYAVSLFGIALILLGIVTLNSAFIVGGLGILVCGFGMIVV